MSTTAEGIVTDTQYRNRLTIDLSGSEATPRDTITVKNNQPPNDASVGDRVECQFNRRWSLKRVLEENARDIDPTPDGDPDEPCPDCGSPTVVTTSRRTRLPDKRRCTDCSYSMERGMPTG